MDEFKTRKRILENEKTSKADEPTRIPITISQPENRPPQNRRPENRAVITPPPQEPATGSAAAATTAHEQEKTPLFVPNEANDLRARFDSVQVEFVDEPRRSVQEAEELVSLTMKRLAEIFSEERQKLEQEWNRGGDVSTEDLRLALRRYRSFFGRLLSF